MHTFFFFFHSYLYIFILFYILKKKVDTNHPHSTKIKWSLHPSLMGLQSPTLHKNKWSVLPKPTLHKNQVVSPTQTHPPQKSSGLSTPHSGVYSRPPSTKIKQSVLSKLTLHKIQVVCPLQTHPPQKSSGLSSPNQPSTKITQGFIVTHPPQKSSSLSSPYLYVYSL